MDCRRRAALELALLAVATPALLVLAPHRPVLLDVALATLGLALVASGWRATRRSAWAAPPPAIARRRADRALAAATLTLLALMVATALALGRAMDPLRAAAALATAALFTPWAWLQQALFQFYLLGRLRVLLPNAADILVAAIDGAVFAAVHAPAWDLVIVTGPAGWLWSGYYLRARRLWPLALSHAALGTGYFYAVRGEDLLERWLAFL